MDTRTNRRGRKHLRVGLELSADAVTVMSMRVVDQPALQQDVLRGPLVARTDLAGQPVLIEAFQDPRISRGLNDGKRGHSYGTEATGVFHVSVPFDSAADLGTVTIRIAEMVAAGRPTDPAGLAKALDGKHGGVLVVDAATLQQHKDWPKVSRDLGLGTAPGRFEIYVDKAGEYRWRLRRSDGAIVADSGEGYRTREACERDLQWVRDNVLAVSIVATKS